MPELPEVETVVAQLQELRITGNVIRGGWTDWPAAVAPLSPVAFFRRLRRRKIESVRRRAKFIVFRLSGGAFMLLHLRMTGQLSLVPSSLPRDPHQHLIFQLSDGRELRLRDTRKFGRCILTESPSQFQVIVR